MSTENLEAAETLRLSETPDFFKQLGERVVRMAKSPRRTKQPRWSVVSEITGHGSGYSMALCSYFGYDPHEKV